MNDPMQKLKTAAREAQEAVRAADAAAEREWRDMKQTTKEVYDQTKQRAREFAEDW